MIDVLDHGYVKKIESWGSDERIIEAARMSTDKGFQGWGPAKCPGPHCTPVEMLGDLNFCEHRPRCNNGEISGDEKLLKFLYMHKHMSPFEMAGLVIEVQAPIFVFREWHRHRTQSYNELSARYTPMPDVNYVPSVDRLMQQNTKNANKQAGSVENRTMTVEGTENYRSMMREFYSAIERTYQSCLGKGLPKEIARLVIPVGRYSRMRASANLRNWLQFLTLRMDPAAQWEIRQYANAVYELIAVDFPRTAKLFAEDIK